MLASTAEPYANDALGNDHAILFKFVQLSVEDAPSYTTNLSLIRPVSRVQSYTFVAQSTYVWFPVKRASRAAS